MGKSSSAPSSYLLTAMKQMFQCASLNDVSDYVKSSTTAPASAKRSSSKNDQHTMSPPGLDEADGSGSASSSSSIYVIPSREALEEMVRDSRSTRRQGLFDMDRLFACGGGGGGMHHEHIVADQDDYENEFLGMQDDMDDSLGTSSGSVFSRSGAKKSTKKKKNKKSATTSAQQLQQDFHPHHDIDENDDAYHFKFHVSPPRKDEQYHQPHKQYTYQGDHPSITPRRTMSDTMSQLPESPSTEDANSCNSATMVSAHNEKMNKRMNE
jgi:hypothetical protein